LKPLGYAPATTPYFILEKFGKRDQHCGSIDINFVLNPCLIDLKVYETIVSSIEKKLVGWGKVLSQTQNRISVHTHKKGKWSGMKSQVYACLSCSLAFLKQQVMPDICPRARCLVCVEAPTLLLPFLNSFAYILVMTNLNTLVFFQFKTHLFSVSIIMISSFGSAITFPQVLPLKKENVTRTLTHPGTPSLEGRGRGWVLARSQPVGS
jgi:hypothetical protein